MNYHHQVFSGPHSVAARANCIRDARCAVRPKLLASELIHLRPGRNAMRHRDCAGYFACNSYSIRIHHQRQDAAIQPERFAIKPLGERRGNDQVVGRRENTCIQIAEIVQGEYDRIPRRRTNCCKATDTESPP